MNNKQNQFRVWDVTNKKFLPQSHFAILGNGKLIVSDSGHYIHFTNTNKKDYVVQEYTGLNDKNNKPVYEGDIVRFNPENPGIATVEFKDYAWVLSESGKAFLPFCYLIKEEVEIIGNLFELPCSRPNSFDHNGECLTCDGWATDCPFINARELNPNK